MRKRYSKVHWSLEVELIVCMNLTKEFSMVLCYIIQHGGYNFCHFALLGMILNQEFTEINSNLIGEFDVIVMDITL